MKLIQTKNIKPANNETAKLKQPARKRRKTSRKTKDFNYPYGSKFNKDLDVVEIAKLVRAEIKEAKKAGWLPKNLKTSVRIERSTWLSSLSVSVLSIGEKYNFFRKDFIDLAMGEGIGNYGDIWRLNRQRTEVLTGEAYELLRKIDTLVSAYHRDESDIMTDYINVNFSKSVQYDGVEEVAWEEACQEWQTENREAGAI